MEEQEPLFEWIDGRAYFRGLPVERHVVSVAGRTFEIAGVKDAADLLDQPDFAERFLEEDIAPYGLELWPSAGMLAERILHDEPGKGRPAIELGCGLGLASIAAAVRGWRVVATDNDLTSLRFAELNAANNDAEVDGFELLDWHHPPQQRRFDRVFAADVLYQLVDHSPLLLCIEQLLAPGGIAILADPNRGVADRFPATAQENGFALDVQPTSALGSGNKTVPGRVFTLRRDSTLEVPANP